jgi:hypothetical protein
LIVAFSAWLIQAMQVEQFVFLNIQYAERSGPQGTYVLRCDEEGLFALGPVGPGEKLPDAKIEEIVPFLEKAYPWLDGKITFQEVEVDTEKLLKDGKVHVLGRVEKAGDHPAATLGDCLAEAKPTEFGATSRVEVLRKDKVLVYDLKRPEHAGTKLEPGDIIHVPAKWIFGR